ncbi:MAG TPA: LLM class F420-dependent oxidoreductase [Acidimicrobiia bacterium]|jgi:F420-dependent oxidoreductase-like protein
MRFGAFVPQGWQLDLAGIPTDRHWETISGVASRLEANGFENAFVFDHFHTTPIPTQEVTYEAWTLMGALSVVTSTIRLGQMCTCNSYRPPAYLAKVAASIDVLSGGRLDMGIGAGWYEHEYLGYGFEFPRPSVRIGQLEEAVQIMEKMWTEDEVHFDGKHYQLRGAICQPKPVQKPHIPLWIAGGGEEKTLRVAARHAAYTNFGITVEEFARKSGILAGHCQEAGTDFDQIVRSASFRIVIAESEAGVSEKLEAIRSHYGQFVDGEELEKRMRFYGHMAGTPDQLIERLQPWIEAGASYAVCYFPLAAYDSSGIDLFGKTVLPSLAGT